MPWPAKTSSRVGPRPRTSLDLRRRAARRSTGTNVRPACCSRDLRGATGRAGGTARTGRASARVTSPVGGRRGPAAGPRGRPAPPPRPTPARPAGRGSPALPGSLKRGERGQRPGREELEVVELARAGAVLGRRHGVNPASRSLPLACCLPRPVVPSPRSSAPGSWRDTTTDRSWRSTADGCRRLVGRDGRRAGAAALVQQAGPGPGHGARRPRPAARPARAGLRVALRGAVPRRGRTPDPRVGRARPRTRLQTPPDYPLDDAAREEVIRSGGTKAPILMNCSGKHAAMLATCVANGWPHRDLPRRPTTRCSRRSPRPSPS